MQTRRTIGGWAAGILLAVAPAAHATTVTPMNLADLAGRAGRIFRGTVVAVEAGTVPGGGGAVPTVSYRIRVTEALKGVDATESTRGVVEIRMVGWRNGEGAAGRVHRASWLRDLPALEAGQEYLLFTTTPSAAGLSTTVGLGQGAFRIHSEGTQAKAVNAFHNAGLFDRMTTGTRAMRPAGPVPYSELAARVRGLVGR